MKISQLIEQLKKLQEEHGDIPVRTESLSHIWPPDLRVKGTDKNKVLILNS